MTKKEQLKVLKDKINANRADFNLNRQTAKIRALATGDLDKYEYLTVEETSYRSNPIEQKRFEYSPLGKVFNKVLENKEYGTDDCILKRLDKIGTTNKKLSKFFGANDKGDDDDDDDDDDDKGDDNNDKGDDGALKSKVKKPKDNLKNNYLKYNQKYNFDIYVKDFNKVTSKESKDDVLINILRNLKKFENFKPRTEQNKAKKDAVLKNARNMYNKLSEQLNPTASSSNNVSSNEQAIKNLEDLDDDEYILYQSNNGQERLTANVVKTLLGAYHDGRKIKNNLKDFKDILENAKQQPNNNRNILRIFDNIYNYMKNNKQGSGLKILTPKQMLSRLPILFAEIQAGNNSKQLKNEARQLIYSLYTSKQLSKKLYNILIKKV